MLDVDYVVGCGVIAFWSDRCGTTVAFHMLIQAINWPPPGTGPVEVAAAGAVDKGVGGSHGCRWQYREVGEEVRTSKFSFRCQCVDGCLRDRKEEIRSRKKTSDLAFGEPFVFTLDIHLG